MSILGDFAILTRGTVFMNELDFKLEPATVDMLDSTGSITIMKEDMIVLNGEGSRDAIQARCEQICSVIADPTSSEYDRTKLQERLAKLSGGVAVINVGGSSEVEVRKKKDRYDDALNATRAADEESILPGGGLLSRLSFNWPPLLLEVVLDLPAPPSPPRQSLSPRITSTRSWVLLSSVVPLSPFFLLQQQTFIILRCVNNNLQFKFRI
jgi:hypothetical protein